MAYDFWPSSAFSTLQSNANGWLAPTEDYWRSFLTRPELEVLPESCRDEKRLHHALQIKPFHTVKPEELSAIKDADAKDSYRLFLRFRDGVQAAGTLQAYYAQLMHSGSMHIPPLFVDLMVQTTLRGILQDETDPQTVRAAELLFRAQRVAVQDGRMVSGDKQALDIANATAGVGEIGRLLIENKVQLGAAQMQVMEPGNSLQAEQFWNQASKKNYGHRWLLDLTHEVKSTIGEGQHQFSFHLAKSTSALSALSRVLERWITHFCAVQVRITPLAKVEDAAWRWHVGLDTTSSALLNDLYQGKEVEPSRMQGLISLFRLDFINPSEMRSDVAGKPVYLGLAMDKDGLVKVKPQNLLLNLPLAALS